MKTYFEMPQPATELIHTQCGKTAFYVVGVIDFEDVPHPDQFRLPDGSIPEINSPIVCGSCGQSIAVDLVFLRRAHEAKGGSANGT